MTVQRRQWTQADGRKGLTWAVDFYDEVGQRVRRQGFTTKREAEDWEHEERARRRESAKLASLPLSQRRLLQGAEMPFSELAGAWLDACSRGLDNRLPVEPRTYQGYEGSVRLHLSPLIGEVPLGELDAPRIAALRDDLLRTRSREKVTRTLRHLRQALHYAVRRGHIASNPAASITVGSDDRGERRLRAASPGDLATLLSAIERLRAVAEAESLRCQGERRSDPSAGARFQAEARGWHSFGLLVRTAALTGLRISELRALSWDAVTLGSTPSLTVTRRADQQQRLGAPKSKASRRMVTLPVALAEELAAWKEECPMAARNYVFPSSEGHLMHDSNLRRRRLAPAMKAAGLLDEQGKAKFSFHGFRHLNASALLRTGLGLVDVAKHIGHADPNLTLSTYAHSLDGTGDERRSAIQELEDTLAERPSSSGA